MFYKTIIIPLLSVALFVSTAFPSWADNLSTKRHKVKLVHVIDGDTIKIDVSGSKETVRLIGIDTPEREANDKALRDSKRSKTDVRVIVSQGQAAKTYLESLLPEKSTLELEFDVERQDHYGRLLAYVYGPDGEMINKKMVADGYAYPMTIPPNVAYSPTFQQAFRKAQSARRGLWANH